MARVFLLALLIVLNACGAPASVPKPRDVLLVTIDTARADRFSYVGEGGPGTPRIDAVARRGAGFTQAVTPVPLTLPAHASLMTGRLPARHTVRDNGFHRLPDAEVTLAELLAQSGLATAAFIGAEVLDRRYGLDQGFATYDAQFASAAPAGLLYYPERPAEEVVKSALAWLAAASDRPVFVWVHLFDPHTPYHPPEPERSRYASGYDGEIAYVDRAIGELLDGWSARRGLDRTLIVIAADHGEALGEHGEKTHGVLVHDATLRVPLIVAAPGLRPTATIDAQVSLIDVLPTICGLMGIPVPAGVEGRDLGPLLRGERIAWSRPSGYAESLYAYLHHGCTPLLALREEGWKLVRGAADEVYDLRADPHEDHDLAKSRPEKAQALARALDAFPQELDIAETVTPDDEARRALKSLGYAGSGPAPKPASRRDPREALASLAAMSEADRRAVAGDIAGSIAGYQAVIVGEPGSIDARLRLSQILVASGRPREAVRPLTEAVAIDPRDPYLRRKLGNTLEASGAFEDALAVYDAGLASHPADRDLRTGRWSCLDRLGRSAAMLAEAERAVARDPSDGAARLARAIACCGRGTDEAYQAALDRELAELPRDPILLAARERLRAPR